MLWRILQPRPSAAAQLCEALVLLALESGEVHHVVARAAEHEAGDEGHELAMGASEEHEGMAVLLGDVAEVD